MSSVAVFHWRGALLRVREITHFLLKADAQQRVPPALKWTRGIVVLVLAITLAGCSKRPDPAEATRLFFEQVAAGNTKAAYASTAFAFQAQQSEKAFETTAKELKLFGSTGSKWEKPEIEGRTAKVRGEITTKGGLKAPLVITLTDESGQWRVFSIRTPRSVQTGISANLFGTVGKSFAFTETIDRPIPDEQTAKQMARESLLLFNEAIRQGSFEDFYSKVSRAWQDQLTLGQLQRAFQPFIDQKVNLAGIKDVEVVLDRPQINTDGLLLVSGHYPTKPYRVHFALKFFYELPRWKLFGIDVNLQK